MSNYVHKTLNINGETVVFLGLDKNLQYDNQDLQLLWLTKTGIETYEGLRWDDYFNSSNRLVFNRTISVLETKQAIKQHEGYRFASVQEFILGEYGDTLWDTLRNFESSKTINKSYRRFKKVDENITITEYKLSKVNKICALYYISPEIIKTGKGSIFLFSDTVKQSHDFKQKESIYRKHIIQNFSSIDDVQKSDDLSQPIGLNKSYINKWFGVDEKDILEYKAIVAYKKNVVKPLAYDIIRRAIEEVSE